MSSISSLESADSHSDLSESDSARSPSARSTDTAAPSSPNTGRVSRSTATSANWTQLDLLTMESSTSTSSVEDSPVRTSQSPAKELVWPEPVPACGMKWLGLLARYDLPTSSWKTYQCSLVEDSESFSETWPRSGTMRNGIAYPLPVLVPLTDETVSGSLPTPAATAYGSNQGGAMGRIGPVRLSLESMARQDRWPTPTVGDAKAAGSRNTPTSNAHPGISLTDAVRGDGARGRMWPTPRSSPNDRQTKPTPSQLAGEHGMNLSTAVRMWPTPAARDWRSESCSPEFQQKWGSHPRGKTLAWEVTWATPTAGDANIAGVNQHTATLGRQVRRAEGTGLLNPTWVELLMGFPDGWTEV